MELSKDGTRVWAVTGKWDGFLVAIFETKEKAEAERDRLNLWFDADQSHYVATEHLVMKGGPKPVEKHSWTGGFMNEKAMNELVRQLMGSAHHSALCSNCGGSFRGEVPIDECPHGCGNSYLKPDPLEAEAFYRGMIEHAVRWGER